jgi:hypothetical protein
MTQLEVPVKRAPKMGSEYGAARPFTPDTASYRLVERDGGWVFHQVSVVGDATEDVLPSQKRVHVRWYTEPTEQDAPAWLVKLTAAVVAKANK